MSEVIQGHCGQVRLKVAGNETATDVAAGEVDIPIGDAGDFDETGGWLTFNPNEDGSTIVAYTILDDGDDTGTPTLRLASPLAASVPAFSPVLVWNPSPAGLVREWVASVVDDSDGSSLDATVSQALIVNLGESMTALPGLSVIAERDDAGEWWVTGIIGASPVITGALIRTAESGERWELGQDGYFNTLRGFIGIGADDNPGELRIDTQDVGGAIVPEASLYPPHYDVPTGLIAGLSLTSGNGTAGLKPEALLHGEIANLQGGSSASMSAQVDGGDYAAVVATEGTVRVSAGPTGAVVDDVLVIQDAGATVKGTLTADSLAAVEITDAVTLVSGIGAINSGASDTLGPKVAIEGDGSIGYDTGAMACSGGFSGSFRAVRFGPLVFIQGSCSSTTAATDNTWENVGVVVPVGMRPPATVNFPLQSTATLSGSFSYRLLTTGELQRRQSVASALAAGLANCYFL